jgi:hypothetical protein
VPRKENATGLFFIIDASFAPKCFKNDVALGIDGFAAFSASP